MAILNKDDLTFDGTYVETIDNVEVTRNYSIDINPNIISHITTDLEENILGSLSINPKNFVFNFSNSLCNFNINTSSLGITTPSLTFGVNPSGISYTSTTNTFNVTSTSVIYTGTSNFKLDVNSTAFAYYTPSINASKQQPTIASMLLDTTSSTFVLNSQALSPTTNTDKPWLLINSSDLNFRPFQSSSTYGFSYSFNTGFNYRAVNNAVTLTHNGGGFDVSVGTNQHFAYDYNSNFKIWRNANTYEAATTQYRLLASMSIGDLDFRENSQSQGAINKGILFRPDSGTFEFISSLGKFIVNTNTDGITLNCQGHTNPPILFKAGVNGLIWERSYPTTNISHFRFSDAGFSMELPDNDTSHTLTFDTLGKLKIDGVEVGTGGSSNSIKTPTVNNKYSELTVNNSGDVIINTYEVDSVNETETVVDTLRYSLDGTLSTEKWSITSSGVLTIDKLITKEIELLSENWWFDNKDIFITPSVNSISFGLYVYNEGETCGIDWGDGTTEIVTPSSADDYIVSHTYTETGVYTIEVAYNGSVSYQNYEDTWVNKFTKIGLSNSYPCIGLGTIDTTLTDFYCNCTDFHRGQILGVFQNYNALREVTLGDNVQAWGDDNMSGNASTFVDCTALEKVTVGTGLTSVQHGFVTFYGCTAMKEFHIKATVPPTIDDSEYTGPAPIMLFGYDTTNSRIIDPPTGFKIYVPMNSVNAYKTATGWSDWASYIEGE